MMKTFARAAALTAALCLSTTAFAQAYGGFVSVNGSSPIDTTVDAQGFTVQTSASSTGDTGLAFDKYKSTVGSAKVYAESAPTESSSGTASIGGGAYAGWKDGLTLTSSDYSQSAPDEAFVVLKFVLSGSVATSNTFITGQGTAGNSSSADAYILLKATSGDTTTTFRLDAHYINSAYSSGSGISGLVLNKTVNGQSVLPLPSDSFFGEHDLFLSYTEGQQISLSAEIGCTAKGSVFGAGDSSDMVCDLAHSLTFAGLTISDSNGINQQINYTSASDSGFDYTQAYSEAAASVPEPASWAMMIAGFGGIGAMTRRQRRLAAA